MLELLEHLSQSSSIGLHEGNMGYALCYLKQYSVAKDKVYLKKGKNLLNDVAEGMAGTNDYSFATGVLGIGWGLEWLSQNKYLVTDTNEVLFEMDDLVYKLVLYTKPEDLTLEQGLLGRILYLYKRIMHRNKNQDFYRESMLIECLNLCIGELFMKIVDQKKMNLRPIACQVHISSKLFILMSKLLPLRLNGEVKTMMDLLAKKVILGVSSSHLEHTEADKRLYANALLNVGYSTNNKIWIKTANQSFNGGSKSLVFPDHLVVPKTLQVLSGKTNNYSWQEGWLLR